MVKKIIRDCRNNGRFGSHPLFPKKLRHFFMKNDGKVLTQPPRPQPPPPSLICLTAYMTLPLLQGLFPSVYSRSQKNSTPPPILIRRTPSLTYATPPHHPHTLPGSPDPSLCSFLNNCMPTDISVHVQKSDCNF